MSRRKSRQRQQSPVPLQSWEQIMQEARARSELAHMVELYESCTLTSDYQNRLHHVINELSISRSGPSQSGNGNVG